MAEKPIVRAAVRLGALVAACAVACTMLVPRASAATSTNDVASSVRPVGAGATYTIYPNPQSVTYGDDALVLRDTANVVLERGIDADTAARLDETLALKSVKSHRCDALDARAGALNIAVGIHGSHGVVDRYAQSLVDSGRMSIPADTFGKTDSYVLAAHKGGDGQADTILVWGRDTDAAFYGLTTLYQIVQQINGLAVRDMVVADWADVKSRGFIEGYYGNPWSVQDRVNLMKWGGYYKLNAYIYAPKDDPKHRNAWRESYTAEQIERQIKPQAVAGNESKVRFVYALAPFYDEGEGLRPFRFDTDEHYAEDLKVLEGRYLQVIDAGVREIALLADDARNWGNDNYLRLLRDLTDWLHELQQETNADGTPKYEGLKDTLPYCPAMWTYTGHGEAWYADMPSNVQIVMTGGRTFGFVTQEFSDSFVKNTKGRAPFMWVNWPCTDPTMGVDWNYLAMGGQNTFLRSGLKSQSYDGIVLNPMQQSEPSKQAIFTLADYAWNLWETDDQGKRAWEDSFSYIDHNSPVSTSASDGLRDLAMNMRILYTNMSADKGQPGYDDGKGWFVNDESVDYQGAFNVYETLSAVKSKVEAGTATIKDLDAAGKIYRRLQQAAAEYREGHGDERFFSQVEPFIAVWDDVTAAALGYIQAAVQRMLGDADAADASYRQAKARQSQSTTHMIQYLDKTKYASVGHVIVTPTMQALGAFAAGDGTHPPSAVVDAKVSLSGGLATGYGQPDTREYVVDGKDDTAYWMWTPGDDIDPGASITVTYSRPVRTQRFRMVQEDGTGDKGDALSSATYEYQDADGAWHTVGKIADARAVWEFSLDSPVQVSAIRVTNDAQTHRWWKLFDLSCAPIVDADVSLDDLRAALAQARQMDTGAWTRAARQDLQVAIGRAQSVVDSGASRATAVFFAATGESVRSALQALREAMQGEERYTAMTADDLRNSAIANDAGVYDAMTYAAYQRAYEVFAVAMGDAENVAKGEGERYERAMVEARNALQREQTARDRAILTLRDGLLVQQGSASDAEYAALREALERLRAMLQADPAGTLESGRYAVVSDAVSKAVSDVTTPDEHPGGNSADRPNGQPDGSADPTTRPGGRRNESTAGARTADTGASVGSALAMAVCAAVLGGAVAVARRKRA